MVAGGNGRDMKKGPYTDEKGVQTLKEAADTDSAPESGPTVGSRSLTLMGNAILLAAQQIREPLMLSASELLETPEDVVVVDDRVADVDRRAVLLEQALDDLDRAVDASAEAARLAILTLVSGILSPTE